MVVSTVTTLTAVLEFFGKPQIELSSYFDTSRLRAPAALDTLTMRSRALQNSRQHY